MEILKNIGQSFYSQGLPDNKIFWDSRTLEDLEISVLKNVTAFPLSFVKSHVDAGLMKILKMVK